MYNPSTCTIHHSILATLPTRTTPPPPQPTRSQRRRRRIRSSRRIIHQITKTDIGIDSIACSFGNGGWWSYKDPSCYFLLFIVGIVVVVQVDGGGCALLGVIRWCSEFHVICILQRIGFLCIVLSAPPLGFTKLHPPMPATTTTILFTYSSLRSRING